jgi:tetratricopeptide (TPR) repeat protein
MKNILFELHVKLVGGESLRYRFKDIPPEKIDLRYLEKSWLLYAKYRERTPEGYAEAKRLANELIERWPDKTAGYYWVGMIHFTDIITARSKSIPESMKLAEEYAQKALQLDESYGGARNIIGWIHLYKGQHDLAVVEHEKWVDLQPSGDIAHEQLGRMLMYSNRPKEAIQHLEMAIRLNPYPPAEYYSWLGSAYSSGLVYGEAIDLDKAIELCKRTLKMNPDDVLAHIVLTQIYSSQNRMEEARAHAAGILRFSPNFSCKFLARNWLFKNKESLKPTLELFRKAGIPEG